MENKILHLCNYLNDLWSLGTILIAPVPCNKQNFLFLIFLVCCCLFVFPLLESQNMNRLVKNNDCTEVLAGKLEGKFEVLRTVVGRLNAVVCHACVHKLMISFFQIYFYPGTQNAYCWLCVKHGFFTIQASHPGASVFSEYHLYNTGPNICCLETAEERLEIDVVTYYNKIKNLTKNCWRKLWALLYLYA